MSDNAKCATCGEGLDNVHWAEGGESRGGPVSPGGGGMAVPFRPEAVE